ncbi:MAG: chemotaxis protein CheX [Thermodesulfobacteriota bacterium]
MESHVDVFRDCALRVLHRMAGLAARVGPAARITESRTADSLSALVGLQGDLTGSVALVFARDVAWRVAGRVSAESLGPGDAQTVHAIAMEMVNTVAGNATGLLLRAGLREGLTPPTIVEGPQVFFGFVGGIETFAVPLLTEEGTVVLLVSLKRNPESGDGASALSP